MSFVSIVLQLAMILGVLLMIPIVFAAVAEIAADLGERHLRRSAAELPDPDLPPPATIVRDEPKPVRQPVHHRNVA